MLPLIMSNAYFRFRRFTVWQDRCAMKVCTDASLFGAWASARMGEPGRVLDAGTGTGLLALMAAQRSECPVDAVEIDPDACAQAGQNFQQSPWADRLRVALSSVQDYAQQFRATPYDFILCNPPFFSNDLKGPDRRRNLALHDDALSLDDLLGCASLLLGPAGTLAVIVPFQRAADLAGLAARSGFFLKDRADVRQTPQHTFFRTMYLFCNTPCISASATEITIKNNNQQYTLEFRKIMEDYYLVPDNAWR